MPLLMLTLTIADLRAHEACDLDSRIADLTAHLGRPVAEDEPIPLRTWWDLATTSIADRWWSLRAAAPALAVRILGVRAACLAARRVLPIWEARYPADPRPRRAIEAAEAWAAEPTSERAEAYRQAAQAAATYAAAAADAADAAAIHAAYAAAYAAAIHAAIHAAYAAAYAAAIHAAIHAAYAADAATYEAERDAQRADLDRLLAEVSRDDR